MQSKTLNQPTVKVTFRISEDLFDTYAERAAKAGIEPENEMLKTLARCRDYNATSPIYLDDPARTALSQITGRLVRNSDDLLKWAEQAVTIRVGGVNVPLSSTLLSRLQSRCFGSTFDELIKRVVTQTLEEYVGMR